MKVQGSLKQYLKWLIGSYIVIGILLLFNSNYYSNFFIFNLIMLHNFKINYLT